MDTNADVIIVGSGVGGLFSALSLPQDKKIILIAKTALEECDSYLAQGGICVQRDDQDYDSFFEDTMRAGHYENRKESVDIMIRSSRDIIQNLIDYGVEFETKDGELLYTKEGAHGKPRILFHQDVTGKEITGKLLAQVKKRKNIILYPYTTMTDLILEEMPNRGSKGKERCVGICVRREEKEYKIYAPYTILATGGIGGCYTHSTNYPHLTGDAITLAKKYNICLEHLDYVQIHPTTLYSKKPGRRFLISESVRGEGAVLYNKNKERFVDELLPRDVVSKAIFQEMEKDGSDYVWLSMEHIPEEEILNHFPNIYQHCLEEGYDVTKECIPVVPAQHYFMGGIWVDSHSKTSMDGLYAVGETSCNGVHGANRLASNSLLESLVFAKRAARQIASNWKDYERVESSLDLKEEKRKQTESEQKQDTEHTVSEIKNIA